MRRKAEDKVASQPSSTGETDVKRLLHELQVHQVELEMQNEELRLANQTLNEYELHMHNVVKMTPAGYFRLDTNDRFVDVNDAWLKMHRYESREEVIGKHFSLMQLDSTSDSALKHLAELHKGMPIPLGDFTSRRKDGTVGHHVFSAHPVQHTGRIVGFEWFIIDITQRKQAEEKFRKSEAHLQSVFRAAPIGVGVVVDRMFKQVNKRMCEMTGYSNEELVGQKARMLYMCDDDYEHVGREKYRQIFDFGTGTVETRWKCKAGHIIDVLLSSTPIDMGGPSVEIVFTALDISERKQVEEDLVKHREQLELLVDDRTRKLKEAQLELIQGERLATLGKLTATVSHELRNPLGTIQAAIFTIGDCLERKEPHRAERALELAERNILRCVNIIEELTSYTRVKRLDLAETSIDEWMERVLDEQTLPGEIHCESDLSSGVLALIDREKLRQAMVNLITNAVHALQGKGSTVKNLRISTRLLEGEYEICVRDDGVGMSDETREKIFEPLYSTKAFGVGLGMVIAKGIVEQHHGEISIESIDGKGTTVTLRLPIRPPEGEAQ